MMEIQMKQDPQGRSSESRRGKFLPFLRVGLVVLLSSYGLVGCSNREQGEFSAATNNTLKSLGIPPIQVKVSHVMDGDTFVYEVDNHPSGNVDLACGVDAFESTQSNGVSARLELESLIPPGSTVEIYPLSMSSDGSVDGLVVNERGQFVNAEMVRSGYAVINPDTSNSTVCSKKNPGSNRSILSLFRWVESEGLSSGPFKGKSPDSIELPWEHKTK